MANTWNPSETYPGVTVERLVVLAGIVRSAREGAALNHDPASGETNWTLGVRAFERTNHAIAAAVIEHPWLSVVQGAEGGPVQFVFAVGGHAVRVCRGDADEVPLRYRQPCLPEIEQQEKLQLESGADSALGRCLRLVVENDAEGMPHRIFLAQVDELTGVVVANFLIPSVVVPANVTAFVVPTVAPVELPQVHAQAIDDDQEATGSHDV